VSDDDVKSYKQIKDDLDGLRLLVEKSELWVFKTKNGDEGQGQDKSKVTKKSQHIFTCEHEYLRTMTEKTVRRETRLQFPPRLLPLQRRPCPPDLPR